MDLKWALKAGSLLRGIFVSHFTSLALAGLGLVTAFAPLASSAAAVQRRTTPVASSVRSPHSRVLDRYAQLPLSFEPNVGQSDPQVKFLAQGRGYGLFLTADKAVVMLRNPQEPISASPSFSMLSLDLLGANPAPQINGSEEFASKTNYLLGNDPRQWHTNVPNYARVHYRDVYPGIDLVYYGRKRQELEYDFVLAPGADPGNIQLRPRGAQGLSLSQDGDVVLRLRGGSVHLRRPRVYQQVGRQKRLVSARYVLEGAGRIGFQVASYDRSRPLIIDPEFSYLTYLGGTLDENAPKIAVDSAFNAYVAGTTHSTDFPTLNPLQASLKGTTNLFVTKFNAGGSGLVFSTYIGGSGSDSAAGVAVDAAFNVYLAGTTSSSDFPTTSGAYQRSPKTPGMNHALVAELNSSGNALVYSSYLSGSNVDAASGVAVGPAAGTVFVTGTTQSGDFPTTAGVLLQTKPAGTTSQFFVSKINTARTGSASLLYSTYLGGTTPTTAATDGGGIAVDSSGDAYVTGGTTYSDMPVVNAFQAKMIGVENAFVAKLNPNGTGALFVTYLGGSGSDIGNGVAVDTSGNAYVTGSTTSTNFPVVASAGGTAYQSAPGGLTDGFLTKLASAGTSLIWSTYIGGSGDDAGLAVAVDANQNAFVAGSTTSTNLTTVNATSLQAAPQGGIDGFVGKFNISGTAQWVTYLGGNADDRATDIAVDSVSNPYIAGETKSGNLPVLHAFQPALKGGMDAFVAHFGAVSDVSVSASAGQSTVGIGNPATFTFTVTNSASSADTAGSVVLSDIVPGNGTFQNASASQGSCASPAGTPSTLVCNLGQMPAGSTATVTVHITATTTGPLTDSATVTTSSTNTSGNTSAGASVTVTDYAVSASPTTGTIPSGQAATYTMTVSPVPQGATFPNTVSLKCAAGVPAGAMCAFSTNPVTPNASPVTSSLTVTTTAPPPGTTAALFGRELGRMYAVVLPLGGMVFLGFSLGDNRKRKALAGIILLALVLGLTLLQSACGSSSSKPTLPIFTKAGTYTITVQAVSGSVTRSTSVSLVVQ